MPKEEALSKTTSVPIEDLLFGDEVEIVRPSGAFEAMDIWSKEVSTDYLTFVTSRFTQVGSVWQNEKGEVVTEDKLWELFEQSKQINQ